MVDNADELRDANPWQPMTDKLALAHLGKLGEEVNELGAAISRCIIQGINEAEPVTGVVNKQWLQNEAADVLAGIELLTQYFKLDRVVMGERVGKKMLHLRQWHGMLGDGPRQSGRTTLQMEKAPRGALFVVANASMRGAACCLRKKLERHDVHVITASKMENALRARPPRHVVLDHAVKLSREQQTFLAHYRNAYQHLVTVSDPSGDDN